MEPYEDWRCLSVTCLLAFALFISRCDTMVCSAFAVLGEPSISRHQTLPSRSHLKLHKIGSSGTRRKANCVVQRGCKSNSNQTVFYEAPCANSSIPKTVALAFVAIVSSIDSLCTITTISYQRLFLFCSGRLYSLNL